MEWRRNSRKIEQSLRIILFLFLILFLLFNTSCSKTQKVYKIGVLSGLDFFYSLFDGFKAKMTELGYIEGKTITYDVKKMNVDIEGYKTAVKQFVQEKVDLVFSFPTEASIEAKAITKGTKISVVFANGVLEGSNFINNIKEPGENITGMRFPAIDLTLRRFEIIMQILPNTKRIWVPFQVGYPSVKPTLESLKIEADKAGVVIVEAPATSIDDLQADLDKRSKMDDIGMDVMLFIPEPISLTPGVFSIMGKFASEHNIPICGVLISDGEYETLFGLLPDDVATGKQAALLADKVLKGTPAGTIPVGSPEMLLRINIKTAQKLGITIPESLISQAVEVIK